MNHLLFLAATVLILCILMNRIAAKLPIPSLLMFIALGMCFGENGFFRIPFDNYEISEAICSISLIFVMFYGGFGTNLKDCPACYGKIICTVNGGSRCDRTSYRSRGALFSWSWMERRSAHGFCGRFYGRGIGVQCTPFEKVVFERPYGFYAGTGIRLQRSNFLHVDDPYGIPYIRGRDIRASYADKADIIRNCVRPANR